MNILPFVTILILVIALTISSFFGGFKESSFAKIGSTGLINAYRLQEILLKRQDLRTLQALSQSLLKIIQKKNQALQR